MALTRRHFLQSALAAGAVAATATRARADGNKRILILGGTNFLGPALVDAARARGHTLTLFNRGKSHPERFPDLEQLRGDRDGKLDALRGRKWDAVIDTSGYVPRLVKDSATLLAPSVSRYVFISTISVYADLGKPVDEDAPLGKLEKPTEEISNGAYGPLKALCEHEAEAAFPGRAIVIRPGLIVGPNDPSDRFTYWPVRLARGGEVLAPGAPTDPVQYIDVRDLAAWTILMIEKGAPGVYNALGPAGGLGVGAFLDGIHQGVGGDAKLTWVASDFLEAHKVQPWSDLPVWVPPVGDGKFAGRIAVARATAAGLRFRPVADTARDTLAWWRALPEARRAKLRAGLDAERERAVLAAWHSRT